MTWRYTFDEGKETVLDSASGLYVLAALRAFARENVTKLPAVKMGIHPYDGHVLTIWNDTVMPEYGPYRYGIGCNDAGSLTIVGLGGPPT